MLESLFLAKHGTVWPICSDHKQKIPSSIRPDCAPAMMDNACSEVVDADYLLHIDILGHEKFRRCFIVGIP